jgi:hypothetical protein
MSEYERYGCGAHFCGFHITRLVPFDSDASLDVIDSESADGVTMCGNQQQGVCTHLTFALPIALRSTFFQEPSQQPWSCDAIKKVGREGEIHTSHVPLTPPSRIQLVRMVTPDPLAKKFIRKVTR